MTIQRQTTELGIQQTGFYGYGYTFPLHFHTYSLKYGIYILMALNDRAFKENIGRELKDKQINEMKYCIIPYKLEIFSVDWDKFRLFYTQPWRAQAIPESLSLHTVKCHSTRTGLI